MRKLPAAGAAAATGAGAAAGVATGRATARATGLATGVAGAAVGIGVGAAVGMRGAEGIEREGAVEADAAGAAAVNWRRMTSLASSVASAPQTGQAMGTGIRS